MERMDSNLDITNFKASTTKLAEALKETSNSMEKIFPILIDSLKMNEKIDHIISNMVTKDEFNKKIENLQRNIKLNEKNTIIRYENRFCSTTNQQTFEWLFVNLFSFFFLIVKYLNFKGQNNEIPDLPNTIESFRQLSIPQIEYLFKFYQLEEDYKKNKKNVNLKHLAKYLGLSQNIIP